MLQNRDQRKPGLTYLVSANVFRAMKVIQSNNDSHEYSYFSLEFLSLAAHPSQHIFEKRLS